MHNFLVSKFIGTGVDVKFMTTMDTIESTSKFKGMVVDYTPRFKGVVLLSLSNVINNDRLIT